METTVIAQGPVDVSVSQLTFEQLRKAAALMRENSIKHCVVKTKKEARAMTLSDPSGHKWEVGEEYFRAEMLHRTIPVPANTE